MPNYAYEIYNLALNVSKAKLILKLAISNEFVL